MDSGACQKNSIAGFLARRFAIPLPESCKNAENPLQTRLKKRDLRQTFAKLRQTSRRATASNLLAAAVTPGRPALSR